MTEFKEVFEENKKPRNITKPLGRPKFLTEEDVKAIRLRNAIKYYYDNQEEIKEKKLNYYYENKERILENKKLKYHQNKIKKSTEN